ncbi:MAG: MBL fold metallo-hydrolase, partial [Luteolibacter sp.]
ETAARNWGMPIVVHKYGVDERIDPAAPIVICGQPIRVAHVPGHSPDSITFYFKDEGVVFAGDTLFAGSVGRTDLPGGSTETLISGIQEHLLTLPPETRVLSGHGPETTIGQEARSNPFVR